jgi:alanine-glyoxylate transaminase/serine-glyoxylate transaminase/serine-pyruvate transaminase
MTMVYALREALRIVLEEGLEARYARHQRNADALKAGLTAMGLELIAQDGYRAPMLTTVAIPDGVSDANIRKALLNDYNIEIGGGLGDLAGKAWRIGLMGESSTQSNVLFLLSALEKLLSREGYEIELGTGVSAAVAAQD